MNRSSSFLANVTLLLVLLAAQWSYAIHDIETIDEDHFHGSECIVCFVEHSTLVSSCSSTMLFDASLTLLPNSSLIDPVTLLLSRNDPIRAPPVNTYTSF